MDWIVFLIYRYFFLPVVFILLRLFAFLKFDHKLFQTLKFRLKNEFHKRPSFNPDKRSIGIHAASGEIEYAYPLIRKIKQLNPDFNIVITLSSASVLNSVINHPDVDAVGPAPLDLFWRVKLFLDRFNFKLFLFSRTDVWPELSYQLQGRIIPAYLISATFSHASANKFGLSNVLTRFALNNLTKILAVSIVDRHNMESIGVVTPISETGDTRYDQVIHKKINSTKHLPKVSPGKKIFVAGSTWPEDDAVLLPVLSKFTDSWRIIVAPHEISAESLSNIERFFKQQNLLTERLSNSLSAENLPSKNWDILIVDLFGYLFHLYSLADLTFVGGSFKSKVHSVMEPLSFFKPVCVGPFHSNNREAVEFGKLKIPNYPFSFVQSILSGDDLSKLLQTHSQFSSLEKDQVSVALKKLITERQGATDRTYNLININ